MPAGDEDDAGHDATSLVEGKQLKQEGAIHYCEWRRLRTLSKTAGRLNGKSGIYE